MADYSTIHGFNVQTLSADPPAPGVGQVWYNTTTGTLKGYGQIGTAAWAAGGLTPGNTSGSTMSGTQTAAILSTGTISPFVASYIYNGTSWTTSPAVVNTRRGYIGNTGCGTETAAMFMAGEGPTWTGSGEDTEQFNGTAWSEVGDLNNYRANNAAGGNQTAAVTAMGGGTGGSKAEEWNGASWTEVTDVPESKTDVMGGGTQTSFITAGGGPGTPTSKTADYWNGTAWTELAEMNTARQMGSRAAVSGTDALIFGGGAPPPWTAKTEKWNGTAWTELADMGSPVKQNGGCGTAMTALSAGKEGPSGYNTSEEWSTPSTTKTFTAS